MRVFYASRLKATLLAFFVGSQVSAQVPLTYYLPADVSYNPQIPTPQQFLGYQVGEWHVGHDQLVGYMRKLAEVSDRIEIAEYGRTHENRPLVLLTITSPANGAKIDQLKEQHRALSDPAKSASLDVRSMPVVVWLGYTVHGNEPSGNNASLLTAYHLAAAQGPAIDSLLNETLIVLDPCINPDGSNRFSSWVNTHRSKNLVTDPLSREFSEPWPGGRSNHYWFDLNRDYLYQQHPESVSRMKKFHEWKPNVLTDHHEMGTNSTFFFQPGIPTRMHPMTPKRNLELTAKIGTYHATALDKIGSLYYTQESFDDFYYGKGSTYPDVNGCIGILFEQGSSRGHAQESVNGVVTFPFTIRNQFTVSLSTLKAAKAMRQELLEYQRGFYRETSADPVKAYVFGGTTDRARLHEMLTILKNNQISVYQTAKDEMLDGRTFRKGSAYVVPMNQPQHRLIKSMFEKRTTFEDSLFYDISSWTMPLCFNVPYAEAKTAVTLGEEWRQNDFPKGRVVGQSSVAYVFEWDGYFAPRTANELMKRGYRLKVASEPFTAVLADGSQRPFGYGTIEVSLGMNTAMGTTGTSPAGTSPAGTSPVGIETVLQKLAEENGTDFYALKTGLTPTGIDLGSNNFGVLRQPKPLLVAGPGVESNDAGEIWHLLDTRVALPLTMADVATVNTAPLDKYNTLILVSGNYSQLNDDKIKRWVQGGGVLVTLGSAINWASEKGLTPAKTKRTPADTTSNRPYALAERYRGAQVIGGAIFQTRLDVTHPLGYGYTEPALPVFRDNTIFLERYRDPYAVPVQYTDKPLLSGFISTRNERLLRGTPAVVATSFGAGKVIAMTDNPNFRAFWYGTNKLFLNALFFGSQISAGRGGGGE
jgi:hypothetical protein